MSIVKQVLSTKNSLDEIVSKTIEKVLKQKEIDIDCGDLTKIGGSGCLFYETDLELALKKALRVALEEWAKTFKIKIPVLVFSERILIEVDLPEDKRIPILYYGNDA